MLSSLVQLLCLQTPDFTHSISFHCLISFLCSLAYTCSLLEFYICLLEMVVMRNVEGIFRVFCIGNPKG